MAAEASGISAKNVRDTPIAELGIAAPRPKCSALASERGWIMPSLEDALARYVTERKERDAGAVAA
jgi:dTDP-4-dehydrorhamnose reductase